MGTKSWKWALLVGLTTALAAGCSAVLGVHDIPDEQEAGDDGSTTDGTLGADGKSESAAADGSHGDSTAVDAANEGGEAASDGPGEGSQSDQALPCSASTCASGCCGTDGACHTEESSAECGKGGGSCAQCTTAQTCTSSACTNKCTPTSCPTGCCDPSGTCVTATSNSQCGTQGAACGACSGNNQCISGQCQCTSSADCPQYQACDLTTHACTSACSATNVCNGGCCNTTTSTCTQGTANGSCGTGGSNCTACTAPTGGAVCESSGSCGCNSSGDCPSGKACNTTTHQCTVSCTGGLICNGACCDGNNCQPGTTNQACGVATSSCTPCTGFDTCQNNSCSLSCSGSGACGVGGCCAGGTCQTPDLPTACGTSCTNCTASGQGHACMSNGTCGCNKSSDCPVNLACQPSTHTCGQPCDGVTVLCNQGCCNGASCVAGTTSADCGYNGELCVSANNGFYDVCTAVAGGGSPTYCTSQSPPNCTNYLCSSYASALDGGPGLPVGTAMLAESCSVLSYTYGCQCGCNSLLDCPAPNTSCVNHQCQP